MNRRACFSATLHSPELTCMFVVVLKYFKKHHVEVPLLTQRFEMPQSAPTQCL